MSLYIYDVNKVIPVNLKNPAITFGRSLSILKFKEYVEVSLPRGTGARVGYIIFYSYRIHKDSPQ
jgi:hypothetical protein